MEAYDDIAPTNAELNALEVAKEVTPLNQDHDMARVLGVKSVVSLSLAAMVGSVLILPGPAVGMTGASAILAVASSAIIVLAAAFDKSEIATAMPVSGGTYVYLAKAFGPLAGSMAGFALWFSLVFKGAFGLAGFKEYFANMIGEKIDSKEKRDFWDPFEWKVKGIALGLLAILLIGNLLGLKKIKIYQKIATLVAMASMWLLSLYGLTKWHPVEFEDHLVENGHEGFIECVAFVYMGYAGLTKICALASEIKNPEKNMPTSIWVSLGLFFPFFSTVLMACIGNIPVEKMATDYAPLYTLAYNLQGKALGNVVGVICIMAMASMANISLMAVARFPFAMARDGLLPPAFAKTLDNDAPYVSLIGSATAMGLSIAFLPVKNIAKLCSAVMLIVFMLVNVSLIVFRTHDEYWYKPTFRSPCFPYLQLFGITAKIIMLVFLGRDGVIATVVVCFLGLVCYLTYGRKHAQFVGIIRVEKCFGLEPENPEPIREHEERLHKHPITERDFEMEIWEYEEDHGLPHEAHIMQVEELEKENLELRQKSRRLEVQIEELKSQITNVTTKMASPVLRAGGAAGPTSRMSPKMSPKDPKGQSPRGLAASQNALTKGLGTSMGSSAVVISAPSAARNQGDILASPQSEKEKLLK